MTEQKGWHQRVADECIRRGAPEGWTVSVSEMLGSYPNYTHYQFTGAVYQPLLRGPRKGRPNYKRPIPGTERKFIMANDEVRAL